MTFNRNSVFLIVVLSLSAILSLLTFLNALLLDGVGGLTIPFGIYSLLTFAATLGMMYGLWREKNVVPPITFLAWFFIVVGAFFGLLDIERLKMEFYINIVRGGLLLGGVWLLKQKN